MKKIILIIMLLIFLPVSFAAEKQKKSLHAKQAARHRMVKKHVAVKKAQKKVHKIAAIPHVRPLNPDMKAMVAGKPSRGFMTSIKEYLVQYVENTVDNLRYSVYKLGGSRFDVSRGIYIIDCSEYVDRILREIYPDAFSNLVDSTGAIKPTTQHYYDFFSQLGDDPNEFWRKVEDVGELLPGDVLVFRTRNSLGSYRSGHVMVVMDKPVPDGNSYFVRVADSAPSGHSEDTRKGRVSGIGIGTLVLKANPDTGQPSAYAWKVGASWKKNVKIAMARPIGH